MSDSMREWPSEKPINRKAIISDQSYPDLTPTDKWDEPPYGFVSPTPGGMEAWPDCSTEGCSHKSCAPLKSDYCFPCTIKMRGITEEEGRAYIKARREEVYGVGCDNFDPSEDFMTIPEVDQLLFKWGEAVRDASESICGAGFVASNASMPLLNEPITLESLTKMNEAFQKAYPIPAAYRNGADMSRATFDELGKSIKLVKPQGEAWLGMNVDNFIGVEIHIIEDVPFGCVEECRCIQRKDYLDALEFKDGAE